MMEVDEYMVLYAAKEEAYLNGDYFEIIEHMKEHEVFAIIMSNRHVIIRYKVLENKGFEPINMN